MFSKDELNLIHIALTHTIKDVMRLKDAEKKKKTKGVIEEQIEVCRRLHGRVGKLLKKSEK